MPTTTQSCPVSYTFCSANRNPPPPVFAGCLEGSASWPRIPAARGSGVSHFYGLMLPNVWSFPNDFFCLLCVCVCMCVAVGHSSHHRHGQEQVWPSLVACLLPNPIAMNLNVREGGGAFVSLVMFPRRAST